MDSSLMQSFSNYELIIVLDCPEYVEGVVLLQEYEEKDNRVKMLTNKKKGEGLFSSGIRYVLLKAVAAPEVMRLQCAQMCI